MKDLLKSYRVTRALLQKAKLDMDPEDTESIKLLNSMLSDVQYAINWLERGHPPDPRRGIHRRSREQRTSYLDPLYLQSFAQPAACGSPTTLSDSERFKIEEALHSLSERERQAYILHVALCFSLAQTADEMGTTKSTVQTYVDRAREKIIKEKESNMFLAI